MRNPGRRLFTVLLTAPALATSTGCTGGDAPASTGVQRDTLADGRIVVRYADLPAEGLDSLVADLRIGSVEGDAAEAFGSVRGIEARDDGRIYVVDAQARELREFGPDGAFLGVVAGHGDGPGELSEVNGVQLGPDGTLWVRDHGRMELVGFGPDGREVARHPTLERAWGYTWRGGVDGNGVFWRPVSVSRPGQPPASASGVAERQADLYVKTWDPASDETDSLHLGEATYRNLTLQAGDRGLVAGAPFAPGTLMERDLDGFVWSGWSGEYRISRIAPSGDTVLVIEAEEEGPLVTEEDRTEWANRFQQLGDEVVNRIRAEVADHFPERKPAVEQLVTDDEGRLWVRRARPDGERILYDVFDASGEHLGSLRVAFDMSVTLPPVVRNGRFYALVTDEMDVPYVVRAPVGLGEGGGVP